MRYIYILHAHDDTPSQCMRCARAHVVRVGYGRSVFIWDLHPDTKEDCELGLADGRCGTPHTTWPPLPPCFSASSPLSSPVLSLCLCSFGEGNTRRLQGAQGAVCSVLWCDGSCTTAHAADGSRPGCWGRFDWAAEHQRRQHGQQVRAMMCSLHCNVCGQCAVPARGPCALAL